MRLVRSIGELQQFHGGAFVPTMGALHDGHAALVRRAATLTRPVVVSVFVNPTQFDEKGDLTRYPRSLAADLEAVQAAGGDVVFAPDVETVYPTEEPIPIPPLPEVAVRPGLEDAWRPGHLAGVCQVVARLLDLVRPQHAIFGEKDYQQLLVVQALAAAHRDRWPALEIVAHDTMRDEDGLAMSSRNVHLSAETRERAVGLFRALTSAQEAAAPPAAEAVMRATLEAHGLEIEYAVVRHAVTLLAVDSFAEATRGLVAARLDKVRLIDNMPMPVRS